MAATVNDQLAETATECVTHATCLQVDRAGEKLVVSSIFSWREKEFASAYAAKALAPFQSRSPIERAVIAFVDPKLLTIEHEMLSKNVFRLEYLPFDWSLNDLTGRGGR